jgi:hypothetical protein
MPLLVLLLVFGSLAATPHLRAPAKLRAAIERDYFVPDPLPDPQPRNKGHLVYEAWLEHAQAAVGR